MSIIIDQLIDDIIELILENMDCQHEVDHDEDGAHTTVDYSLKNETTFRWDMAKLIEQTIEKIPKEDE